jgi:hypothetical protein
MSDRAKLVREPTASFDPAMVFYSDEEWCRLSPSQRREINIRREENKFWPGYKSSQAYWPLPSPPELSADVFMSSSLPPQHPRPLNQWNTQWARQDVSSTARPANLGRAPAPPITPHHTPSVSSSSDGASCRSAPGYNPQPWTIGSAQARQVYGWTGGDGKEIKFVGYGPDAEDSRNRAVDFRYKPQIRGTDVGPRLVGDDTLGTNVPLAPRSLHNWARLSEQQIGRCPDIRINAAYETIPVDREQKLFGYCSSCSSKFH